MLLALLVIADAHKEDVARVFGNLRGILLPLDLVDGRISRVVELQLDEKSRFGDVAAGNHHQVGIPLTRGILAVDDVLVLRPDVGHGEHAGQGILVVVRENARMLVMSLINTFCHGLFVA